VVVVVSDSLPSARAFEYEESVERVRARLRTHIRTEGPGTWGFALYRRRGLDPWMQSLRVLGFVTMTDSGPLTSALVSMLPRYLRPERVPFLFRMVSITREPELLHEALPGVLLHIEDGDPSSTQSLSAPSLPPFGLIFLPADGRQPHGWPS
jgi:hypothetical protein